MLVLSRRLGERIVIDGEIIVTVVAVQGNKVRLSIVAPEDVRVDRQEVHERRLEFADAPGRLEIETHVQSVLGGRVRDFCLLVREGGLVLHGYARAYYAKQLAQHAVMEATDLPILANEIAVA